MAYKYLFRSLLFVLLGIYVEVELSDHIVILFLVLSNYHTVLHSSCAIVHSHQ